MGLSIVEVVTTACIGNHTEWEVGTASLTRYYYAGSTRVAMRRNNTVYYLLGDHLGSTSVTTDQNGQNPAVQLYAPWGEVRYSSGSLQTRYTYTGQYSNVGDFGLMYYNARWYDPLLSRFTSADTIVPQPGNPQAWDLYSYVQNSPLNFTDPSGHRECEVDADECLGKGYLKRNEIINNQSNSNSSIDTPLSDPSSLMPPPILGYNLDQNECITSSQCIRGWEIPWWWDTDPKNPDYFVFSINRGNIIGVTVILIVDRFGSIYMGIGGNIGKSISPFTGSVNGGWIGSMVDDDIPDQGNIGSFFKGLSVNGQIGALGDLALTWSPHDNEYLPHIAVEYGAILPFSIGVSITYGVKLVDGYQLFGRPK